jgi:hypothetical protein
LRHWISNFLRSPAVLMVIGGVATLVLFLAVVVALGGVFTAQMVSIALEAQRAREAALQNYLEQVGKLLIEKPLHRASVGDNLSAVVRAQTLSVLEGLDPVRKRILILFLYDSGLIYKAKPVVSLEAANLIEATMRRAQLSGAALRGAALREADLREADLTSAHLYTADLTKADLRKAYLSEANLSWAYLIKADLSEAFLGEADLSSAYLMGDNLRKAYLGGADLSHATVTNEQLRAARSLEGATMWDGETLRGDKMPNGPTFEDWLRSWGYGPSGRPERR